MKKVYHLLLGMVFLIIVISIIIFKLHFNTKIVSDNILPPEIITKPDKPDDQKSQLDQFFNKLIYYIEEWNNYQQLIDEQDWDITELDFEDQERWKQNLEQLKVNIINLINNFLIRRKE